MVCRCATHEEHEARRRSHSAKASQREKDRLREELEKTKRELAALTPDATSFAIVDALEVGNHLLLKVRFASCEKCSFEGDKVMVYLDRNAMDALRWRKIDPHFCEGKTGLDAAPSPAARFPASAEGWLDAQLYAHSKSQAGPQ